MATQPADPAHPFVAQIAERRFPTARRGFDPDEVRSFLQLVAEHVAQLEEEAARERARGELLERQGRAAVDAAYERLTARFGALLRRIDDETEEVRAEALAAARAETERVRAEAGRIRTETERARAAALAAARAETERVRAEAEGVRAEVLAAGRTEAQRLVDEARAEAARIVQQARAGAAGIVEQARGDAERIRAAARADAERRGAVAAPAAPTPSEPLAARPAPAPPVAATPVAAPNEAELPAEEPFGSVEEQLERLARTLWDAPVEGWPRSPASVMNGHGRVNGHANGAPPAPRAVRDPDEGAFELDIPLGPNGAPFADPPADGEE